MNATSNNFDSVVSFALFINDTIETTESIFESENTITTEIGNPVVNLRIANTIGNTIQLRLNKDDRLSIRVIFATGIVRYRFASLVIKKIAD